MFKVRTFTRCDAEFMTAEEEIFSKRDLLKFLASNLDELLETTSSIQITIPSKAEAQSYFSKTINFN